MFKIIKTSTYKELLDYKAIAKKQDEKIVDFTTTMINALDRIIELETKLHHLTSKRVIIKSKKPQAKNVSNKTNDKK